MAKIFKGDAWSSDEYNQYTFRVKITKDNAVRLLKAMAILETIPAELNVNCLRLWDDDSDISINNGMDDIACDVACARVCVGHVYWDFKNKHTADVYETDVFSKESLQDIVKPPKKKTTQKRKR